MSTTEQQLSFESKEAPEVNFSSLFEAFSDFAQAGKSTTSSRHVKRWEQTKIIAEHTIMSVRLIELYRTTNTLQKEVLLATDENGTLVLIHLTCPCRLTAKFTS